VEKTRDENRVLKEKLSHMMAQHDLREERVESLAKLVESA
jgi:hypothetical protein